MGLLQQANLWQLCLVHPLLWMFADPELGRVNTTIFCTGKAGENVSQMRSRLKLIVHARLSRHELDQTEDLGRKPERPTTACTFKSISVWLFIFNEKPQPHIQKLFFKIDSLIGIKVVPQMDVLPINITTDGSLSILF